MSSVHAAAILAAYAHIDGELKPTRPTGDAVVLVEFAIEEFGRAVELRDKLNAGSLNVEQGLFRDHDFKYEKAWTVLDKNLKSIYEGTFDPTFFDQRTFDTKGETISPRTRLDAAFVNYSNGTWKDGVRADSQNLKRLIEGIREEVNKFIPYR